MERTKGTTGPPQPVNRPSIPVNLLKREQDIRNHYPELDFGPMYGG